VYPGLFVARGLNHVSKDLMSDSGAIPSGYRTSDAVQNLPFSEWPQVFTNARLCKAVLDRLTDQAHIIETGAESYRFRRTLGKKRKV
jgi:hypothetical protein